MASSSALRSGIKNYERYLNVLSGTDPYVAPPPSAYDLLATEILTGTESSVTFSNLNSTYGADYQHLQIRAVAQQTSGDLDTVYLRINGVSTNTYSWHQLRGILTAEQSTGASTTDKIFTLFVGDDTNDFGIAVIDCLDPFETTKYTTVRSLTGALDSGGNAVGLLSGLYQATTAVDSISLHASTGSLNTGSRFSLYGLKA